MYECRIFLAMNTSPPRLHHTESDTPAQAGSLRVGSEPDQSPRRRSRLEGHDTLGCKRQPQALSSGIKPAHGVAAGVSGTEQSLVKPGTRRTLPARAEFPERESNTMVFVVDTDTGH